MLTPILDTADNQRNRIRDHAVAGIRTSFPMKIRDHHLEVEDVSVHHKEYGPDDQKRAILEGGTLHEPIKGTVVLKNAQGDVVERVKNMTLMHLPYFTERHTFIVGGNEYQVANQIRMKPGVYTRKRANEEMETQFNLSKGMNFRMSIEPETGAVFMKYETTMIPLYPVLRKLGVPHMDIANAWGADVARVNETLFARKMDQAIDKLYSKLIRASEQTHTSPEGKITAINGAYSSTAMDPEVNRVTLGAAHDKVNVRALLDASKKLLSVYKSDDEVDDRDSLAFKTFHSVSDFVKERIQLDARAIASKVRLRGMSKTAIRDILPSAPFSGGIRSFLTTSQLSSIPTGINPMELIDHSVKVTSMGEGGIGSERAIPFEAREVHSTHLGILDPVRTPESFSAGVDIRASMLAHRDVHGNLYTPVKDLKTGKFVQASPAMLAKAVVMFPNQPSSGLVEAMDHGKVAKVPRAKCQYEFYNTAQFYSPAANLLPFLDSMQGNRATMASKMQTQALPLIYREAPFVQTSAEFLKPSGGKHLSSFEHELGKLVVPTTHVGGTVEKIDHQFIYIRPDSAKKPQLTKKAGVAKRQKTLRGVILKVEMEPGDTRTGVNKETGEKWAREMKAAYGYFPGTRGGDGECLDFYWKESGPTDNVYVVHQVKKDGAADEDKVMLGFSSKDEAKKCFLDHVPEWCFGSIDEMPWDTFESDYLTKTEKTAAAAEEGLVKIPYAQHYPFASKTGLTHDLHVKAGDTVAAGQVLGDSNYTRNGTLALGKNLRTAYMAYYGFNSNDAVVISEGAANKLTSEHMYREAMDVDADMTLGKEQHRAFFGAKYTAAQYAHLDAKGVVRKGATVMPHDPIIVGVRKSHGSSTDAILGNLRKSLIRPYTEIIRTWEHESPGEVLEVFQSEQRVMVVIRTHEPMRVGDKLSGRHGNKGVVSKIIADHEMIRDEGGRPIDVIYTSQGVISRINPSQILETALGKVAEKTGKPVIVENFTGRDNVKYVKEMLAKHGLKDKETVLDPVSGKKIPGVLVGHQFTLRLFKTTDTNFSARGTGTYDANQQPTKGGEEGAKGLGMLEFNGLLAHNARAVLKEAATIKSQKNEEFWKALQLGLPLPKVHAPFAFSKFIGMLQGAGIAVDKHNNKLTLMPMTDKHVTSLSAGAIENEKLVKARDLSPERGGLFDPVITGGTDGAKWSHIDLAEPIVNPVFVEPARRLLGLSTKDFHALHASKGGGHIRTELNKLNIGQLEGELTDSLKRLKGTNLDDAVKRIKFLRALKEQNLKPGDAYVISKLAVLPPVMRPIMPTNQGGNLIVGDANELYRNAILHNKVLGAELSNSILPPEERQKLRTNLYEAVGAVIGTHETDNPKLQKRNVKGFLEHITGKTTPKSSFFQAKVMKRQMDVSGRGTIAPDGSLGMDQVGIPEDMLWGMFSKFVIARLVRQGFNALMAKEMVEKRTPPARDALMIEIKERPVMVNRAPSLHRYNIVGAYAVPTPGKTIAVNPFIEKGMNADYDGDTFQVHAPVTHAAIEDVKKMTLSHLVFGDRNKDDLMVAPTMEAVLGIARASAMSASDKPVRKFKNKAEALAAYHRGDIKLNDPVEIGV
jgi:DNA-directed RNA polymerase beta subunit